MISRVSKMNNVVIGILQISAIIYLLLLTISLLSLTFFYNKDTYHYFGNEEIELMVISGEHVIGKTGQDGTIDVLLKGVQGFIQGSELTYVKGDGEFLIINELTGTFQIKKVGEATPIEMGRLEKIIPLE